jgi:glycosyltransferase involved in cell wall biosynthesis
VIDVILPCLNEAEALPWVLSRIPAGARAIVVDNGSADGSAQLARQLDATVVPCPRRGYGAACHAGLDAATAEVVVFCDCDASIDPSVLVSFAAPVREGRADLVVGRRRTRSVTAWPPHARLANAILAGAVRRATGIRLHDIGPVRAGRRSELLNLGVTDRRSGYPLETVLLAARAGWQIAETDVEYLPRAGRSKVTGTLRGTTQAIRDMSVVLAR